ncbi:sensor histidine kinase [Streptomyces albipurpureus]|uniref:histidine kinase n=1 Tax=Streptomyces albipurpureus TaxID=2897419 RepID=A0ABT0USQ6_9ACTN|nr:ATP-binding protein [Streptomyces sp. CWNU-1]MCM2391627.1 ATP-binding protein [Streptomyces sp. CWNU-1]
MSVPVAPKPRRIRTPRPLPLFIPLGSLVVAGAVGGAAIAAAPAAARNWVAAAVTVGWVWVAAVTVATTLNARRLRSRTTVAGDELRSLQTYSAQAGADCAHLVNVTLPSVVKRLRDGESAESVLSNTPPPGDPQLRRVVQTFATELAASEERARISGADSINAVRQLAQAADDLDRLTTVTLPAAIDRLRNGASGDTALAELEQPADPRLRVILDSIVREFAFSERRAAAAQGASAKVLSRVQAKAVSMLADLRDMQDRHGEAVFGDLLKLDHNTSQLGLLTDRLALLMGGRASRAWNKPIGMESILRGAVGRIAAYQRVRLHSSSTAAVAGYAAEGVMHLLAELMDNAANFSPPIDEVHVYVEERSAGIVVTIEDSGLKMADAAMRRAEEAVSGRATDLATLQSTRLGLVVVGLLAVKYGMNVSFRPSSRGGTGVVVLFPPQLLHQSRGVGIEAQLPLRPAERAPDRRLPEALPAAPSTPASGYSTAPGTSLPAQNGPRVATPNGLPVRPPGRTMAAADRGRGDHSATPPAPQPPTAPRRDAGTQFGAFHRARKAWDEQSPKSPDQ